MIFSIGYLLCTFGISLALVEHILRRQRQIIMEFLPTQEDPLPPERARHLKVVK